MNGAGKTTPWHEQPQFNTSLEEILASMGENGERRINGDFEDDEGFQELKEIGTADTPVGTKNKTRVRG